MDRDVSLCVFIFSMVIRGSLQNYGYLEDPPARGSMWRFGYSTPQNYNDRSLNCGGVDKLNTLNGACGICGDPFDGPREHEAGGRFATGEISHTYSSAQQFLPITIRTTVYQPGYFEIRICPNNNPQRAATQECLDKHLLQLTEGTLDTNRTRYEIPPFTGDMEYTLRAEIPAGMLCTQCVLQWRYISSAPGPTPTSLPEEYRNCADISIDNSVPAPNIGSAQPASATGASTATNGATGNATDILNPNSVSNQDLLSALLYLADLSPSPNTPLAAGTTASAQASISAGSGTGGTVGPQPPQATPTADTLLKQLLELGILVPVDTTVAPGAMAGSLKANSVASTVVPIHNTGTTVPKAVSTTNSVGTSNNKTSWAAEKVVGASGNPFLWYSPEISPTVAKPRTSTVSPTGVLNHPVSATTARPNVPTTTTPYILTTTTPYVPTKPTTSSSVIGQTAQTTQHINNNTPTNQHRTISVPKSAIEFVPEKRTGASFANVQAAAGSLAGTNTIDPYVQTSHSSQSQAASNSHTHNLLSPSPPETNHIANGVTTVAGFQSPTTQPPKSAIEFVPEKRTGASFANVQAAAGSLAGTNTIDPYVQTPHSSQSQTASISHTNNLPSPQETNHIANGVTTAAGFQSPTTQPPNNHVVGQRVPTTQNILDALNRIAQMPTAELSKRMQRLPTNPTVQPTSQTRNKSPSQIPTSSNVSKPKATKTSPEYIVGNFNGTTALFSTENERTRFRNILNNYSTAKRNLILKLMKKSGVNKISVTPVLSGNRNSKTAPGNNEIHSGSDFMGTQQGKKMMASLTRNGNTTPIGQFQPSTAEVQSPEVLRTRNTNVHTPERDVGTGVDMTSNLFDNRQNINAELNARMLENTHANSLIQRRANNNNNSLQSLRRRANERRNRGQRLRNQNQGINARNGIAPRNNQAQRQNARGWQDAARRQNPFARSNNLFGRQQNPRQTNLRQTNLRQPNPRQPNLRQPNLRQPNPRQPRRSNNAQFNTLRMQQRGIRQGQGTINRNFNNIQQGLNQFRNRRAGGLSGGGQNGRSFNFAGNFQEPAVFGNAINRQPLDFPNRPQLPFINDRFPRNNPILEDVRPPLPPLDGRPPLPPLGIGRGPLFAPGFRPGPGPFFPPMDNFIL